jgi:SAM-dependent methyltransferase
LADKIDVVTSTQVLLHIPREPMRRCLRQIHHSLKPGGLFLATIHLRDLFADSDKRISDYNHLRYSTGSWERWVNSPLMSYNRFKARDYRELLEEAGFTLLLFAVEPGSPEHVKALERLPIAPCFQRYSREELAARHLLFVAQKK